MKKIFKGKTLRRKLDGTKYIEGQDISKQNLNVKKPKYKGNSTFFKFFKRKERNFSKFLINEQLQD